MGRWRAGEKTIPPPFLSHFQPWSALQVAFEMHLCLINIGWLFIKYFLTFFLHRGQFVCPGVSVCVSVDSSFTEDNERLFL